MKTNPRLLALLLSSLAACQSAHDPAETRVAEASSAMTTTCGAARWIGIIPSCAAIPNWAASQLFPGATPPLDAYCVYEWTGMTPPTAADTTLLATTSGAFELAEDCPVVVPQASYDTLLADSLRTSLQARVGTASALGVNPKGKTPVRVIVVDTAPDSGESTDVHIGHDRHGDTLAGVIRDIGTGPQGASVEVVSSLGLPWLDEETWSEQGGHVGRLSDLARGVYNGMEIAAAHGRDHVIVNLSVGWENLPGLAECNDTGPSTAPSHAVYDVLQRARCSGAIVLAAAGNDAGGPSPPTGMTCPARWESLSIQACDENDRGPMLHAVGGVDYADRPIAVTRPLGRPRLAATSLGGVGWASTSPIPSPLNGTSVATAVASGVAAVVWSQRPSMSGAAVMDALHDSGVHAGTADACAGGSACDARRISLCAALGNVGVSVNCNTPPAGAVSTPPLSTQVLGAAQQAFPSPSGSAVAAPVGAADLPRYLADGASLSGGVFPQPVVPICPSCVYVITPPWSIFYASLSVNVREPTLVMETSNSTLGAPLTTSTGSTNLAAGSYAIPVTAAPSGVTRAWLTGYADPASTVSVTQEVLISP